MKKSQKALETKFVEVPLPKFHVEDIAGTTMTTDSEAGQAYQQYGKIWIIGSLTLNCKSSECVRIYFSNDFGELRSRT